MEEIKLTSIVNTILINKKTRTHYLPEIRVCFLSELGGPFGMRRMYALESKIVVCNRPSGLAAKPTQFILCRESLFISQ